MCVCAFVVCVRVRVCAFVVCVCVRMKVCEGEGVEVEGVWCMCACVCHTRVVIWSDIGAKSHDVTILIGRKSCDHTNVYIITVYLL